jgi:dihydroxy-acid dehydratase
LLEEGDEITIDAVNNVLSVNLSDDELEARRERWQPYEPRYQRGVLAKYASHVTSASTGAVTDKF